MINMWSIASCIWLILGMAAGSAMAQTPCVERVLQRVALADSEFRSAKSSVEEDHAASVQKFMETYRDFPWRTVSAPDVKDLRKNWLED